MFVPVINSFLKHLPRKVSVCPEDSLRQQLNDQCSCFVAEQDALL